MITLYYTTEIILNLRYYQISDSAINPKIYYLINFIKRKTLKTIQQNFSFFEFNNNFKCSTFYL